MNLFVGYLVKWVSEKFSRKKGQTMNKALFGKLSLSFALIMLAGTSPVANAATGGLHISKSAAAMSSVVKLSVHATGAEILAADNGNLGGSPTGFADASFRIDTKSNRICYKVTTSDLAGVVAGHIHTGAKGVDGGVAVALDPAKFNHGITCKAVPAAVINDIVKNPSLYYFNLHSTKYSGGAVRAQLEVEM